MIDKVNYYLYKSNQFPTLPTIYTSLIDVMSNPRSSIQDLADVIMKDQASVVKLLKVVNSSLFGIKGRINTVNQAIFYLGFNEVKNLLLALSVMNIFEKINHTNKFNIVDLWKHSIAVGVISRIIAIKLNIKVTENFFIAGIIHDIGKLFFIHFFDDLYSEIVDKAQTTKRNISDLEIEVFGISHEKIGAELAKKWNLPLDLKNVIEFHEQGQIGNKSDVLLSCIHISNIIATMLQLGFSGDSEIPEPTFEIWNYLNLPSGSFQNMYESINSGFVSANNILSLRGKL
jgi:putative nucleotidyltransferase with HDIG domain